MADLTITAGDVAPVKTIMQFTGPAAETIAAGQYVRFDASTGKMTKGNATSAGEAADGGIALDGGIAGQALTAVHYGIVDVGDALAALDYGAEVFLSDTDGVLADAAGSTAKRIGVVVPGWGNTTADKLLFVDLRHAATIGAGSLVGTQVSNVAADNVIGGVPVVHIVGVAGGAAGNEDVTLTHKTRVIDVWAIHTAGAGEASDTIQVFNGANAITDAMAWSGADKALVRAASIDDAYHVIAAGGTLRVTTTDNDTGGDVGAGIVYVLGLRSA